MRCLVGRNDEFDLYGIELELGKWAYVLDQLGVTYGPGWYPFREKVTRSEPDPVEPLLNRKVPTGRTTPVGVRISPGVANYSWGNEYVTLEPVDHRVRARMTLFVRKQGMGAMIRRVEIAVDLRERSVTIPPECPAELHTQAQVKGERILDLLTAARRERRRGAPIPLSVLGQWEQDRRAQNE